MSKSAAIYTAAIIILTVCGVSAQSSLNPAGAPRYGNHALAPGFAPSPFIHDALSGGDINVKSLGLGDNCLGYAARDPDFVIELTSDFPRITFLSASAGDTTKRGIFDYKRRCMVLQSAQEFCKMIQGRLGFHAESDGLRKRKITPLDWRDRSYREGILQSE